MAAPARLSRCSPSFLPKLLLTFCTALCIASPATAQEERLYAVELIVFARDGGAFEEIWPDSLVLRYPDRARQLARPADTAAPTLPLWTALDRNARQLGNVARSLERQSGTRVLFHERWVQPAQWQGRAAPIAVSGGTRVGTHHELEGYVTLRVGRFLHVDTHLWLAEFGGQVKAGQGSAPAGSGQVASGNESYPLETGATPPFRLPELPPAHGAGETEVSTRTLLAAEQGGAGTPGSIPGGSATAPFASTAAGYAAPAAQQVQPSQIVTLTQQRRVRFGELHYFDHPRFGAIVQVTDYKSEPAAAADTAAAQPAVR